MSDVYLHSRHRSQTKTRLMSVWEREERRAGRIYWWLFLSPLVTVPVMYFVGDIGDYGTSAGSRIWGVLWATAVHLAVLPWIVRSPRPYVRRHKQQGWMLIGLRALSALLFVGLLDSISSWSNLNALLWLGGSIWGWYQVRRGNCWLMRRKGDLDVLPRPWANQKTDSAQATDDPWSVYRMGKELVAQGLQTEAISLFVAAFRHGSAELRTLAATELEALGEVETF